MQLGSVVSKAFASKHYGVCEPPLQMEFDTQENAPYHYPVGIHALALGILISRCAPNVGPRTMAAIVSVESGGNPYAIDDDDAHVSYSPTNLGDAVAIASRLQSMGHNFDAGIAQINSSNFATEHLAIGNVFDPCLNLKAGSEILSDAYRSTKRIPWLGHEPRSLYESHEQEQLALYHAFSTYNSGDPERSLSYAKSVVSAATGGFSDSLMARYLPLSENRTITRVAATNKGKNRSQAPVLLTFSPRLDPSQKRHGLPLGSISLSKLALISGVAR